MRRRRGQMQQRKTGFDPRMRERKEARRKEQHPMAQLDVDKQVYHISHTT